MQTQLEELHGKRRALALDVRNGKAGAVKQLAEVEQKLHEIEIDQLADEEARARDAEAARAQGGEAMARMKKLLADYVSEVDQRIGEARRQADQSREFYQSLFLRHQQMVALASDLLSLPNITHGEKGIWEGIRYSRLVDRMTGDLAEHLPQWAVAPYLAKPQVDRGPWLKDLALVKAGAEKERMQHA